MKIEVHTDDVLVIEDRPWIFGLFISGAIVILAWASLDNFASGHTEPAVVSGLFALFLTAVLPVFIKRVMLTLDRSTGQVTLTTRSTRKQTTKIFALADLAHADVSTTKSSDGDEMYAVELNFAKGPDKGTHAVTDVASSGDGAHEAAKAINAWLALDRPAPAA